MTKRILSMICILAITASTVAIQPTVTHAATPTSVSGATSSIFGPNVYVFDPSMNNADIQTDVNSVFTEQESNEFGNNRYALLFKPGNYNNVSVRVGFYEQVAGLGKNPDDVFVNALNADAKWDNGNATRNFWRSVENLSFGKPTEDAFYAVSQAAPMRRAHIKSKALLLFDFDQYWNAGWASGGYIADSKVEANIVPGSQQQFFSRNNDYPKWDGTLWNTVLVGDKNPPANSFPSPTFTVIEKAPAIKEKPYLYVDELGAYKVFVPSLQIDRKGVSWPETPGASRDVATEFYIAKPGVTAATINEKLNEGKSLIFTPGIYHMEDTINITKPNTVVLGLGLATIEEDTGKVAMKVADVEGVSIAGLMFEASLIKSVSLLEVGTGKNEVDHSANPIVLSDLFFRVGGTDAGTTDVCLIINSNNVIGDHFWIWRADHGDGSGWDSNISKNGLVVNGDDVTLYGLFNEHHEEYQTLWNGNGGRVYFYQSEIPYDPPTQDRYMSHNGTVNGYAAYKVADHVTTHEAWGLGIYSNFTAGPVKLESAVEVPKVEGVKLHSITTVFLNGIAGSGITHIVNDSGESVYSLSPMTRTMTHYASGDTQAPSIPQDLTAVAVSGSQINLSWSASTDNVGVEGYDIYRNGKKVASTGFNTYSDAGLNAEKSYTYFITAKDSAGNQSANSETVSATTLKLWTALSNFGWTAVASHNSGVNNGNAANMIDGNSTTQWSSDSLMVPGMNFVVDLKAAQSIGRIVIHSPGNDYARGYEIYVSDDGTTWGAPVASGTGSGTEIIADLGMVTGQFIKVQLTESSSSWWKVSEFSLFTDTEKLLNRNGWTATTDPVNDNPANLFDGSLSTRWSAGKSMVPGQSITIDMKSEQIFNKILIDSTGSNNDYSRSFEIYVSDDGLNWGDAIVNRAATGPVILSDVAEQSARYIKIVQTGTNSGWWSVHEIYVYRDGTQPVAVNSISVTGADGASTITSKGDTLQMNALVLPAYADDPSVTWAVYNTDDTVTDKAFITQTGMLASLDNGTVKVVAMAEDGSLVTGSAMIEISGQEDLVTSITVTGDEGASVITSKGGTLQMNAVVLPEYADDPSVTWSVLNTDDTVTDKASITQAGLLTSVNNGTVKVVATASDGSGVKGSAMITISGQEDIIPDPILVTGISVTGANGANVITSKGGTLQMSAAVLPENASNKEITWSVYNVEGTMTDLATIKINGLLTAAKNGSVKVVATANDGSGITSEATITISGQVSSGCTSGCGGGGGYSPPTPNKSIDANQQSVTAAELNKIQGGTAVVALDKGKTEAVIPVDLAQKVSSSVQVTSAGISILIPSKVLQELAGKVQGNAGDSKIVVRIVAGTNGVTGLDGSNLKLSGQSYNLDLVLVDKDGKETKLSTFSEPVLVVLPYDGTRTDKDLIGIYVYDEASKAWQYVGGKVNPDKQTITTHVPHFSKYAVLELNKAFADVPATHWVNHTLKVLAAKHIVSGVSATEFNPNGKTTRVEFVSMLVKALGLKATKTSTQFTDVNASAWYALDITAAFEAGLITGMSDTLFEPNEQITREQMAILLVRAYEYVNGVKSPTGDNLADLNDQEQVSTWAKAGVNSAIDLGLMKGQSATVFAPQSDAIRAETAQAIYNLLTSLK
ncbi:discoidin domain-containing protein [Cohnella sp. WQ 127256]|uniref:discoidin domain-containing protein n=1 Tax=Cohnella sp. WQ 127256 TaxID=2938790 RepID=UPI0021199B21|nr:discoidin domain-containing protein [Cohnella sp. WQ 127256]